MTNDCHRPGRGAVPFIYVISAGPTDHKIGIANDPRSRLLQLQVGNPNLLRIVFTIQLIDAARVEGEVHTALRNTWIRGEWFLVSADKAVSTIRRVAGLDAPEERLTMAAIRKHIVRAQELAGPG